MGSVVVTDEFHLLFAVVEDFQEEHPPELFEPLRVAVGAGVLAHDVLDGFDEVGDVGHGGEIQIAKMKKAGKLAASWTGNFRSALGFWDFPGALRIFREGA